MKIVVIRLIKFKTTFSKRIIKQMISSCKMKSQKRQKNFLFKCFRFSQSSGFRFLKSQFSELLRPSWNMSKKLFQLFQENKTKIYFLDSMLRMFDTKHLVTMTFHRNFAFRKSAKVPFLKFVLKYHRTKIDVL